MSRPAKGCRDAAGDRAGRDALRLAVEDFNAAYADVLDRGEIERWPDFFTEDALYRVTARENFDAGLPAGVVWCEGRAMIRDRAAAVRTTMVHEPRYLRHYNSNVRITAIAGDGIVASESNYLVVETLMEQETRIFQAGRYIDRFARDADGALLLAARSCVYDSLLIPNAMVFPA